MPAAAGYRVFVYYRATPADPWGLYGYAAGTVEVTAASFSAISVSAPTGAVSQAQGTSLPVTWTTNAAVSGGEFSLWAVSPSNGWYVGKIVPADGSASYADAVDLDVPAARRLCADADSDWSNSALTGERVALNSGCHCDRHSWRPLRLTAPALTLGRRC